MIIISLYTEHGYAKEANQNAEKKGDSSPSVDVIRKSQRLKKQIDRLCFAGDIRCVVCKHRLQNIGINLYGVVCSMECLDKSKTSSNHEQEK